MTAEALDDTAGVGRPPSVSVRNARLVYDTETLFAGLDFNLDSGAITALLGPSGVVQCCRNDCGCTPGTGFGASK